jgi:hypothetical protein
MLNRKTNKIFTFGILALLILSSFATFVVIPSQATAYWLDGWSYRKPILISQTAGTGVNYDIEIIVYNTTGSDSGNKVYVGTNSLSWNFGDISFTSSNSNTPLNYWQQYVNSTLAIFWVQVSDDLSASAQTIDMYYGKASQTTGSNIATTFPIGDDFASAIGGNWSWVNEPTTPASHSVATSYLTIASGGQNVEIWATDDTGYQLAQALPMTTGYEILAAFNSTPTADYHTTGVMVKQNSTNWAQARFAWLATGLHANVAITHNVAGTSAEETYQQFAPTTPNYYALKCISNSFSLKYSKIEGSWTTYVPTFSAIYSAPKVEFFLKTSVTTAFSSSLNWIVVRRAVATEPTLTFGTEISEESSIYSITITASDGGTVSVATDNYFLGDNQAVDITATGYPSIHEILLDGNEVPAVTYIQTEGLGNSDYNAKVSMVNSSRYIICNNWTALAPVSPAFIRIYSANSSWQDANLISTSTIKAFDIYVPSYHPANKTLICGRTGVNIVSDTGFIATYDVISHAWTWVNQTYVGYITNIFNPVSDTVLIQVALNSSVCFYKTTTANLMTPSTWTVVDYPSWNAGTSKEARIAYFNGYIYMQQSDATDTLDFSYCLGRYNLDSSTWDEDALISGTDTTKTSAGCYVFGYVTASANMVVSSICCANGTYSLFYSTDGTAFNFVRNVVNPAGGESFGTAEDTEYQCWAEDYKGEGNFLLLSNTKDDFLDGYLALIDLSGDMLSYQTGFVAHDTECVNIYDGNYVVCGTEIAQVGTALDYPAGIKIVRLEYGAVSSMTINFVNIRSDHALTVNFASTFGEEPEPSPTPTPTSTPTSTPSGGGGGGITPSGSPSPSSTNSNSTGGGFGGIIGRAVKAITDFINKIPPWAIWGIIAVLLIAGVAGVLKGKKRGGGTPSRSFNPSSGGM